MFLFDVVSKAHSKKNVAIVSPIRQHIRLIDERLKARSAGSPKGHTCNQDAHRYQRMKYMGIPLAPVQKSSDERLRTIVAKVSQTSMLTREIPTSINKSPLERKQTATSADVKLKPRIPEFDYTMEEERERSKVDKFVSFSKAQPRGTNARNLRVDKSLPWIEDELNATKVKLAKKLQSRKTFAVGGEVEEEAGDVLSKTKFDADSSAIKKSYKEVIASQLRHYKAPDDVSTGDDENDDADDIQSAVESTSSLSSVGTNFTNDSGSFLMELGEKIPKSEMNLQTKFQVSANRVKRTFLYRLILKYF